VGRKGWRRRRRKMRRRRRRTGEESSTLGEISRIIPPSP
jgi:hypothetical protein